MSRDFAPATYADDLVFKDSTLMTIVGGLVAGEASLAISANSLMA